MVAQEQQQVQQQQQQEADEDEEEDGTVDIGTSTAETAAAEDIFDANSMSGGTLLESLAAGAPAHKLYAAVNTSVSTLNTLCCESHFTYLTATITAAAAAAAAATYCRVAHCWQGSGCCSMLSKIV
jgi:hypothetical protein